MAEGAQKRRKVPWWVIVLLVLAIVIVYFAIPKPITVQAATVSKGTLQLALSTTGYVEGTISDVNSRLSARIVRLYVDEGDPVSKGQVIAQLESADLLAEVSRGQAVVSAAEENLASLQRTASVEARQRDAALAQAQANLQAASENLRQLQAGTRPEDIAAQRAVVAQAEAQAQVAHQEYERARRLFAEGAIAEQRVENAQAASRAADAQLDQQQEVLRKLIAGPRREDIAAAQAQVRAAQAGVAGARAALGLTAARQRDIDAARANVLQARAVLENARVQLTYTTIVSPIAGVVARKFQEVGEMASQFNPIYSIANLSRIWVTAEVDEEDVAAVARGQTVAITLDAFPGRQASGMVMRVSKIAEPKEVGRVRAKVVRTRIELLGANIPLRPGMEVNITGSLPAGEATLLAPNDSVIRVGEEDQVYVIHNGVARVRKVKVGQYNFQQTQILSGLREGEVVAVSDLDRLTDGAHVKVSP